MIHRPLSDSPATPTLHRSSPAPIRAAVPTAQLFRRARAASRLLAGCLGALGLTLGCQEPTDGAGTDGITHWLACASSADCQGEARCVCGVCTPDCESDADCEGLHPGARCESSGDLAAGASCGEVAAGRVCAITCVSAEDCGDPSQWTCGDEVSGTCVRLPSSSVPEISQGDSGGQAPERSGAGGLGGDPSSGKSGSSATPAAAGVPGAGAGASNGAPSGGLAPGGGSPGSGGGGASSGSGGNGASSSGTSSDGGAAETGSAGAGGSPSGGSTDSSGTGGDLGGSGASGESGSGADPATQAGAGAMGEPGGAGSELGGGGAAGDSAAAGSAGAAGTSTGGSGGGLLWAETDASAYALDGRGTATLHNDSRSDAFLPGCESYYYEQQVDGLWLDRGPELVLCEEEGNARPVSSGTSFESAFGPFEEFGVGTWRLRYLVGRGCQEDQPLSVESCTGLEEVFTPTFTVGSDPAQCGDPVVMARYSECTAAPDEDTCVSLGGSWTVIGLSTEPRCLCQTGDGDCPCTENSECLSLCYAPTGPEGIWDCSGVTHGTCAPSQVVGCHCILEADQVSAICID